MLETTTFQVRNPGRRSRDAQPASTAAPKAVIKPGAVRTALTRAILAIFFSMFALVVVPPKALAGGKAPAASPLHETNSAAVDRDSTVTGHAAPATRPVAHRHRKQPHQRPEEDGEGFPRRPYLGAPNVVVTDPAEYPRPECLENYNPDSFWYSMRPNIFNVPVEPEWDFYNIINTVRPDYTDAVYTVGKGVTVLENGYTFHKINTAATHISTRQLPESLLRYGINDEFEVMLKWPGYLMTTIRDQNTGAQQSTFGSEDIDTSFKWELLQQDGWRPLTALVAGMTLPTGSPGVNANFVQPHFNILAGWGFRRWLYLKWQTGCDYLHTNSMQVVTPQIGSSTPTFITVKAAQNSWHESLCLLTQWTKRVGAFHEWFMISGTGGGDRSAQHYLDMGLYLYMTPNIQFDVRVGRQISDRTNNYFTGAGFSGRW